MSTQSEVLMKMLKEGTKKYYVESTHDVYEDSYEDGEGKHVNTYEMNSIIKGNTVGEAIEKYFEKVLGFECNFNDNLDKTENGFETNTLVDVDNIEVTESTNETDFKQWKEGRIVLYINRIIVTVYEMVKVS